MSVAPDMDEDTQLQLALSLSKDEHQQVAASTRVTEREKEEQSTYLPLWDPAPLLSLTSLVLHSNETTLLQTSLHFLALIFAG